MFGLGKRRSRFGKWIDERGISQQEVMERSGVSRGTIGKLVSDDTYQPNMRTANRIIKALRQYDTEISAEDFWG